jgi:predicted metal-dependent enzyme (double-stranded beta helix superfamily)
LPYQLSDFLRQSEEIVRSSPDESKILRNVRPLMSKLLQNPSIPDRVFRPRTDRFANNLIYMPRDRAFSVTGAVWLPGQTTPIHDHLTWAIVGIYRGEEREAIFRRTDDGRLIKASERVNEVGHITTLGRAGIHRIDNPSNKPSLSIHMYGLDIGGKERHSYDPASGEISKFVSGYCNVLRDDELG